MPRRIGVPDAAAEVRAIAKDELAQETAPAEEMPAYVLAPGFVHVDRPDGLPVVFTPGERLPDWAVAQLREQQAAK